MPFYTFPNTRGHRKTTEEKKIFSSQLEAHRKTRVSLCAISQPMSSEKHEKGTFVSLYTFRVV